MAEKTTEYTLTGPLMKLAVLFFAYFVLAGIVGYSKQLQILLLIAGGIWVLSR